MRKCFDAQTATRGVAAGAAFIMIYNESMTHSTSVLKRASEDEQANPSPVVNPLHHELELTHDALLLRVIHVCLSFSLCVIVLALGCPA